MRDVLAIVDLQYGSTGKGQIAGTLGRLCEPDTVVCANGPNAGHTYKWWEPGAQDFEALNTVVHTVLPVTSVLPSVRNILLGPGSVIDLQKLASELLGPIRNKRLIIHPNASIVLPHHRELEKSLVLIGSTMKGTAEAVIEKMRRGASSPVAKFNAGAVVTAIGQICRAADVDAVIDYQEYDTAIDSSNMMVLEGAQGHSLSMHGSFYPYCTSRDVSLAQLLADCRIPAIDHMRRRFGGLHTVGVCRTYPIRVANRYNESGDMVGSSGPYYPDQEELKWTDISREAELTTVTKLPRRLFSFSTKQIMDAARYNAPMAIALTFCDYLLDHDLQLPAKQGDNITPDVARLIHRIELAASCPVAWLSYGASDRDLFSPNKSQLGPAQLPC